MRSLTFLLAASATSLSSVLSSPTHGLTARDGGENHGGSLIARYMPPSSNPRMFILTDITSDPDDEMSMVRYLTYSNHFNTRGLCATTSTVMRSQTHPEAIEKIIRAYGEVVDNLRAHAEPGTKYPDVEDLLPLVTTGPKMTGMAALKEPPSPGALMLIERLEESSEPLYVSIWGGGNTLAQALNHLHQTRSAEDAAVLRSRLRIYAISDQDDSGTWMRRRWPDVFWIIDVHMFAEYSVGSWSGITSADNGASNITKVQESWLDLNIRVGPLGAVYPAIKYGMEGDTPSFLWLVQNGLSNGDHPEWGGWGGRHGRVTEYEGINEYGMSQDGVTRENGQRHISTYATVWRWRDAFQDEFATRMQWTLHKDFSAVPHPPIVRVNCSMGPQEMHVSIAQNDTVILDASNTIDLDHPDQGIDQLEFEWAFYQEATFSRAANNDFGAWLPMEPLDPPPGTNGTLAFNDAGFRNVVTGPRIQVTNNFPEGSSLAQLGWHIILQVRTKKGPHRIRRYKRIVVSVA